MRFFTVVPFGVFVFALQACSSPVAGGDSESHFLGDCAATCGSGLECVCGVCTKTCSAADECTPLGAAASCVDPNDVACSSLARTCDVACQRDEDCGALGSARSCIGGRCREATASQGVVPASPPEGAVSIQINPSAGGACNFAGSPLTAPVAPPGMPDAVKTALTCSLTDQSCDPFAHVVVDGEPGTTVDCQVHDTGSGFDVSVTLTSGSRMEFSASGHLEATGGTLDLRQSGVNTAGAPLSDATCTIDVQPNLGRVAPGTIWATFHCLHYGSAGGSDACIADGAFAFENCRR